MKKVVLFSAFLLSVGSLFAQLQERLGVKSVIGASAVQKDNLNYQLTQTRNGVNGTFTIKSVGVQVGLPYMGVTNVTQTNNPSQNYRVDLGFPWGIRYRYSTFSEDAFKVLGYQNDIAKTVQLWATDAISSGATSIVCSPFEAKLIRSISKDVTIITPGVRLPGDDVGDQARVMTPKDAIENGANFVVIGRSITNESKNGSAAMQSKIKEMIESI